MMDQQDINDLARIEGDKFIGIASAKILHGDHKLGSLTSLSKAADIAKGRMDSLSAAMDRANTNQGDN